MSVRSPIRRHGGYIQPKMGSGLNDAKEPVEVRRLVQVAVREALISIPYVSIGVRCSEHGYRNKAEHRICFDRLKEFLRVVFRKVEVEENQAGARGVTEFAFAAQKLEGFLTVDSDTDGNRRIESAQSFAHEPDVCRIVFDDKDLAIARQTRLYQCLESSPAKIADQ